MPFYQQLVGTGSGALSNLAQLSGGNLVAPFDPMQTQGQNLGAQNALNYGQQATDVMAQTAGGQGLEWTRWGSLWVGRALVPVVRHSRLTRAEITSTAVRDLTTR
jgi:hypothetical protein